MKEKDKKLIFVLLIFGIYLIIYSFFISDNNYIKFYINNLEAMKLLLLFIVCGTVIFSLIIMINEKIRIILLRNNIKFRFIIIPSLIISLMVGYLSYNEGKFDGDIDATKINNIDNCICEANNYIFIYKYGKIQNLKVKKFIYSRILLNVSVAKEILESDIKKEIIEDHNTYMNRIKKCEEFLIKNQFEISEKMIYLEKAENL